MDKADEWDLVAQVKSSKNRLKVLQYLESPAIPSEIASDLDMNHSNVSRTLRELREIGLVELLTPDRKKGRLYKRTQQGESILDELE